MHFRDIVLLEEKWFINIFNSANDSNFAALIALYVLAQLTGLIDTHLALILIYVGGAIPMNTWLMKGYFDTIPKELDESARMDGAGHFRIFGKSLCHLQSQS